LTLRISQAHEYPGISPVRAANPVIDVIIFG